MVTDGVTMLRAAEAYNEEHGDPADTLHHGRGMIEAMRAALSPIKAGEAVPVAWPPLVDLSRTIAFFASVIKSGEAWSATCQQEYDKANLAIKALAASPQPEAYGVRVTEEMVERACRRHNVGWSLWHEPQKKTAREVMRAALEAALSQRETKP
jgi:hypothetical protein